jgi:putative transposase
MVEKARKTYPTDMTDDQWELFAPCIPPAKPGGRPREVDMRDVLDAIFYVDRAGGSWRMLPGDFPPWQTVYTDFRNWTRDGTWEQIHDILRRSTRVIDGRHDEPSAGIIDSQSVKTVEKGGRGVTTRARKSKAASGTSSSTPWG